MDEIILKAERRSVTGKQVKALRREGLLPGVLYGRGFEPVSIVMNLKEAMQILSHVASSTLVSVELEGQKHLSLVRERQRDYLKGLLKHVDFQVVSMKDKLRVEVRLEFIGESNAIKNYNGILVNNMSEITVECLPQDLPGKIQVNLALLKHIGDAIYVRDLVVSDKIHIINNGDEAIAVVAGQATDEALMGEGGAFEPEVIEKGKKEEDF